MAKSGVRAVAAAVAGALALAACSGGPTLVQRAPEPPGQARFDGRALLVLSDVDMPGTGYADGRLAPISGATDTLAVVDPTNLSATAGSVSASNSVMAWPGSADVSPDGRFAYVVETRAAAPAGMSELAEGVYTGMPIGRVMTTIDLTNPALPRVVATTEVGDGPTAVQVSPDGRFALISRKDNTAPVAAVILDNGLPTRVVPIALPLAVQAQREIDHGALFVRLAPNGRDFAINVANTHVQFATLEFDANGLPIGARAVGEAVPAGQWITVLRWANDGRHLIVADVAWGSNQLGAALNGPGQMVSIAFDPQGAHRIASQAQVSLSPEGFDLNRAGDLLAVVNMERTYLPERLPYTVFGRRAQSSVSLVSFDPASGALTTIDGPVAVDGVLPEDAVFDADGDMIAIAVFHEKGETPQAGWVDYMRIDRSSGTPRLVPTGQRTPTVRGAHDLVLLP